MPKPRRGALRELLAAQADDDRRLSGEILAPIGGFLVITSDRAGNQPLVGGKVLVGANIDRRRRIRGADQSASFCPGDIVVGDDMDAPS